MTATVCSQALVRSLVLLGTACALTFIIPAAPAAAQASKILEISSYQGADREQRLVDGARREGNVLTFYSNAPPEDNAALVSGFEKKYAIKVNLWRASSEDIRQRSVAEARAKRFDVDFILNNGPAIEATHQEKILQEVKSPYVANLMPQAVPAHRAWVGFCLNVFVQAYNTNLVKKQDLPNSYEDLLDPKWKGRLGIEADDSDWFAGLMGGLGEDKGVKLFRAIAVGNGFSVRKGHTLLTNLIGAGEVPLGLTIFNYTAEQLKKKGAPLDWFVLQPLISMPNSVAVAAMAPHPNTAILFFDYMLSDAQNILAARDYVVTSSKIASAIDRNSITVMDSEKVLKDGDKWQHLYTEVISSRQ